MEAFIVALVIVMISVSGAESNQSDPERQIHSAVTSTSEKKEAYENSVSFCDSDVQKIAHRDLSDPVDPQENKDDH